MKYLLTRISDRAPKKEDVLPWVQRELIPFLKFLWTSFNLNASEYNTTIIGKKNYHGFVNRTDSLMAISGDFASFSIGLASGKTAFEFYYKGELVRITSTDQASGILARVQNFVYYKQNVAPDGAKTYELVVSQTPWSLNDHIPAAIVYHDGTVAITYEERHGYARDLIWHEWAHSTIGARFSSGFELNSMTISAFSVGAGVMCDEDVRASIPEKTSCLLMYKDPTNTFELLEASKTVAYKAVANVLKYDSSGSLTSVTVGNYMNTWMYATTCSSDPIHVVIGNTQFGSTALAAAELPPNVLQFSVKEFAPIWRLVWRQQGASTIAYSGAVDLRYTWQR